MFAIKLISTIADMSRYLANTGSYQRWARNSFRYSHPIERLHLKK